MQTIQTYTECNQVYENKSKVETNKPDTITRNKYLFTYIQFTYEKNKVCILCLHVQVYEIKNSILKSLIEYFIA